MRRGPIGFTFASVGVVMLGLASGTARADATVVPAPPPTAPTVTTTTPVTTAGAIPRRELVRVLDAQPGMFLQHVTPEPRFVRGRFYGWRLAAFFPGDARFSGVDLRAGDIILRVNGSSVERPEQLIDVWQSLRRAKELVVEIDRNGAGKRLRWSIAD